MRAEEALELTERLRDPETSFDDWVLGAARAYGGGVWSALGHLDWDEYCRCELHENRVRRVRPKLSRAQRQVAVFNLTTFGVPTSAIASALNVRTGTVISDRRRMWTSIRASSARIREQHRREWDLESTEATGTAFDGLHSGGAW